MKEVSGFLNAMTHAQVAKLQAEGQIEVPAEGGSETVTLEEVVISSEFTGAAANRSPSLSPSMPSDV